MPLLYREAPLNSVWEGSGNVNALDVLRALAREPEALEAWITEVGLARGADARLDRRRSTSTCWRLLGDAGRRSRSAPAGWPAGWPPCLQGSLLVRFAPPEVADVFCASRLGVVVRRHVRRARRRRPARDRGADHAGELSAQRSAPKSIQALPSVAPGQNLCGSSSPGTAFTAHAVPDSLSV